MASDLANSLIKQIADLRRDIDTVTRDDVLRKKLLQETWKLLYDLETPGDSMRRIIYLVWCSHCAATFFDIPADGLKQPLQLVAVRIAVDLNLFERLDEASEPLSVEDLAKRTSADPLLIGRCPPKALARRAVAALN